MTRSIVCFLLLSAVTFAQAPTTFEVASIRPSSEQVTQVSAGLRVAGSQVRVTGMSLKDYIGMAYGVKPQQIEGPDWLGQQRFDLAATIPAGGSAAQLGDMLQALLADRFKMTMHREKKESPVYALGVAKGGAKIQPSAATPEAAAREKAPEVNDVTLELAPEDYMPVMIRSAVNAGVVLPPQALRLLDGANADPFSNPLRNAGLTLESRKSPLDVIVVDAIAKTPTEN